MVHSLNLFDIYKILYTILFLIKPVLFYYAKLFLSKNTHADELLNTQTIMDKNKVQFID